MLFPSARAKLLFSFALLLLAFCISALWGVIVAYFALPAVALVMASLVYVVVLVFRPFWITLAFLFAVPLGALFQLPVTSSGFPLSLAIAMTGLVGWVVRALVNKDPDLFALPTSQPMHMLMLAFLLCMSLSLINSADLDRSLTYMKRFTYYIAIYYFVTYTIKEKAELTTGLAVLLISYFIVSLVGLHEAISGKLVYELLGGKSLFSGPLPKTVQEGASLRLDSVAGNPEGHAASMLIFFLLLLSPLALYKSTSKRAIIVIGMLLALANMFGAAFRGAFLGLAVSLPVLAILAKLRHKWVVVGICAPLILLVGFSSYNIFPELNIERLVETQESAMRTVKMRERNTRIGLRMALDHPIIGNGPDGFVLRYTQYSLMIPEARQYEVAAHNTYIRVLAEYGIFGFTVFVSMLVIILRNVLRVVRTTSHTDHYLALSILGILIAEIAMMIGKNNLFCGEFWSVVAVAGAVDRIYRKTSFIKSKGTATSEGIGRSICT